MKVRVPSTTMKDVGNLEHILALPTIPRIRHGIKTICAVCGKQIEDEFFFGGFAQGQPNRLFHFACLDELSQAIAKYPQCQFCHEQCKPGEGHLLNGNYVHNTCQ